MRRSSGGDVPVFIGCKMGEVILSIPIETPGRRFMGLSTFSGTVRDAVSFEGLFG